MIGAAVSNPHCIPTDPRSYSLDLFSERTAGVGYVVMPPEVESNQPPPPRLSLDDIAVEVSPAIVSGAFSAGQRSGVTVDHPLWLELRGPPRVVLLFPILLILGSGLAMALVGWARRLRAALTRASLGAVTSVLDPGLVGRPVVLEGHITAMSEASVRFEDGEDAVASTASTSKAAVSQHAPGLTLRVGSLLIPIKGPVEVCIGSRTGGRPRRLEQLAPSIQERLLEADDKALTLLAERSVTFRSLEEGDRVLVAGVLQPGGAGEVMTYREAAHLWELHPQQGAALRVAFASSTRTPRDVRPLFVGAALGAVLWLLVSAGTGALDVGL